MEVGGGRGGERGAVRQVAGAWECARRTWRASGGARQLSVGGALGRWWRAWVDERDIAAHDVAYLAEIALVGRVQGPEGGATLYTRTRRGHEVALDERRTVLRYELPDGTETHCSWGIAHERRRGLHILLVQSYRL